MGLHFRYSEPISGTDPGVEIRVRRWKTGVCVGESPGVGKRGVIRRRFPKILFYLLFINKPM